MRSSKIVEFQDFLKEDQFCVGLDKAQQDRLRQRLQQQEKERKLLQEQQQLQEQHDNEAKNKKVSRTTAHRRVHNSENDDSDLDDADTHSKGHFPGTTGTPSSALLTATETALLAAAAAAASETPEMVGIVGEKTHQSPPEVFLGDFHSGGSGAKRRHRRAENGQTPSARQALPEEFEDEDCEEEEDDNAKKDGEGLGGAGNNKRRSKQPQEEEQQKQKQKAGTIQKHFRFLRSESQASAASASHMFRPRNASNASASTTAAVTPTLRDLINMDGGQFAAVSGAGGGDEPFDEVLSFYVDLMKYDLLSMFDLYASNAEEADAVDAFASRWGHILPGLYHQQQQQQEGGGGDDANNNNNSIANTTSPSHNASSLLLSQTPRREDLEKSRRHHLTTSSAGGANIVAGGVTAGSRARQLSVQSNASTTSIPGGGGAAGSEGLSPSSPHHHNARTTATAAAAGGGIIIKTYAQAVQRQARFEQCSAAVATVRAAFEHTIAEIALRHRERTAHKFSLRHYRDAMDVQFTKLREKEDEVYKLNARNAQLDAALTVLEKKFSAADSERSEAVRRLIQFQQQKVQHHPSQFTTLLGGSSGGDALGQSTMMAGSINSPNDLMTGSEDNGNNINGNGGGNNSQQQHLAYLNKKLMVECAVLNHSLGQRDNIIKALESELSTSRFEIAKSKRAVAQLLLEHEDIDGALREGAGLAEDLQTAQAEVASLQGRQGDLETENLRLSTITGTQERKIKDLSEQHRDASERLEALKEENRKLRFEQDARFAKERQDFHAQITALNEKILHHLTSAAELRKAQMEELQELRAAAAKTDAELRECYEKRSAEAVEHHHNLEHSRVTLAKRDEEIARLGTQMDGLRLKARHQDEDLKELLEECDELTAALAAATGATAGSGGGKSWRERRAARKKQQDDEERKRRDQAAAEALNLGRSGKSTPAVNTLLQQGQPSPVGSPKAMNLDPANRSPLASRVAMPPLAFLKLQLPSGGGGDPDDSSAADGAVTSRRQSGMTPRHPPVTTTTAAVTGGLGAALRPVVSRRGSEDGGSSSTEQVCYFNFNATDSAEFGKGEGQQQRPAADVDGFGGGPNIKITSTSNSSTLRGHNGGADGDGLLSDSLRGRYEAQIASLEAECRENILDFSLEKQRVAAEVESLLLDRQWLRSEVDRMETVLAEHQLELDTLLLLQTSSHGGAKSQRPTVEAAQQADGSTTTSARRTVVPLSNYLQQAFEKNTSSTTNNASNGGGSQHASPRSIALGDLSRAGSASLRRNQPQHLVTTPHMSRPASAAGSARQHQHGRHIFSSGIGSPIDDDFYTDDDIDDKASRSSLFSDKRSSRGGGGGGGSRRTLLSSASRLRVKGSPRGLGVREGEEEGKREGEDEGTAVSAGDIIALHEERAYEMEAALRSLRQKLRAADIERTLLRTQYQLDREEQQRRAAEDTQKLKATLLAALNIPQPTTASSSSSSVATHQQRRKLLLKNGRNNDAHSSQRLLDTTASSPTATTLNSGRGDVAVLAASGGDGGGGASTSNSSAGAALVVDFLREEVGRLRARLQDSLLFIALAAGDGGGRGGGAAAEVGGEEGAAKSAAEPPPLPASALLAEVVRQAMQPSPPAGGGAVSDAFEDADGLFWGRLEQGIALFLRGNNSTTTCNNNTMTASSTIETSHKATEKKRQNAITAAAAGLFTSHSSLVPMTYTIAGTVNRHVSNNNNNNTSSSSGNGRLFTTARVTHPTAVVERPASAASAHAQGALQQHQQQQTPSKMNTTSVSSTAHINNNNNNNNSALSMRLRGEIAAAHSPSALPPPLAALNRGTSSTINSSTACTAGASSAFHLQPMADRARLVAAEYPQLLQPLEAAAEGGAETTPLGPPATSLLSSTQTSHLAAAAPYYDLLEGATRLKHDLAALLGLAADEHTLLLQHSLGAAAAALGAADTDGTGSRSNNINDSGTVGPLLPLVVNGGGGFVDESALDAVRAEQLQAKMDVFRRLDATLATLRLRFERKKEAVVLHRQDQLAAVLGVYHHLHNHQQSQQQQQQQVPHPAQSYFTTSSTSSSFLTAIGEVKGGGHTNDSSVFTMAPNRSGTPSAITVATTTTTHAAAAAPLSDSVLEDVAQLRGGVVGTSVLPGTSSIQRGGERSSGSRQQHPGVPHLLRRPSGYPPVVQQPVATVTALEPTITAMLPPQFRHQEEATQIGNGSLQRPSLHRPASATAPTAATSTTTTTAGLRLGAPRPFTATSTKKKAAANLTTTAGSSSHSTSATATSSASSAAVVVDYRRYQAQLRPHHAVTLKLSPMESTSRGGGGPARAKRGGD